MKHIMIDAETLSVRNLPVLLSLAAIRFDPFADTVPTPDANDPGNVFYMFIDIQSCLELGGNIDVSTLMWWMAPEQAAARQWAFWSRGTSTVVGPQVIQHALVLLNEWVRLENQPPDYRNEFAGSHLWSHGLTADVHWLQNWYERTHVKFPFGYRDARDTRTLFDMGGPMAADDFVEPKIKHHPAWDCWAQARAVQNKLRRLGVKQFGG